jgi:hypothetical protein
VAAGQIVPLQRLLLKGNSAQPLLFRDMAVLRGFSRSGLDEQRSCG